MGLRKLNKINLNLCHAIMSRADNKKISMYGTREVAIVMMSCKTIIIQG